MRTSSPESIRSLAPWGASRLGAGLLLAATILATLASAAEPAAGERPASSLADTTRPAMFLKETVVTGYRYPRAYYDSPLALSYVSRTQLRQRVPIELGDVLATLPGVDNSKDSPWEQRPIVRGLSGQRVLVLMDGTPMNSARGNGPHPSLVDPSQVERIEVVRGPSSVAYGSDALGGAINIITRGADPADGSTGISGAATLSGSSAEKLRGGTLELVPRRGKLSAYLSGGARKAEDFRSPDRTVANSGFSDYQWLAGPRLDLTDHLALTAGWQHYQGKNIGIPGLNLDAPGDLGRFSFPFYKRDLAHLTLDHRYSGHWLDRTRVRFYWQREQRDFYSQHEVASSAFYTDPYLGFDPTFNPAPAGASAVSQQQDRYFDLDTWGGQLQLTSIKTRRTLFTAGLDAARDQTDGDNVRFRTAHYVSSTGGDSLGPQRIRVTASVPDGRFANYGSYVQGEWYARPQWTVSAGGRYTHYRYRTDYGLNTPAAGPSPATYFPAKSVDDDALSGSVGVVYAPATELRLSANVSSAYREPNAQDLFFNGPASVGTVIGNPDLKPERGRSYDVGLRWGVGTVALSGNLFYSTFDNLINAVPVGPGTYKYTNVATARTWGGEAEGEWRFRPRWTLRSSLSGTVGDITSRSAIQTLYAIDADKVPLELVPPFKGNGAVRYSDDRGRFWVEAGTRYSWRTNRLPPPIPGVGQLSTFKKEYIVGDLMAGARLHAGQRVVLGVRNFTDRRYRPANASVEDPGLSFVGSLSTDF